MAGLFEIALHILKEAHENSFSQSDKMIMIKTEYGRRFLLKQIWNVDYKYKEGNDLIDYSPIAQK